MNERFDRLLLLRGDPVKGMPTSAWSTNLGDLDRDQVMRGVIEAIRKLLLPQWESMHPEDKRPHEAVDAAEAWVATKSPEAAANAKTAGKACTTARNETFGNDHRVPEAARAVAWAAGGKDETDIWDALTAIEGELELPEKLLTPLAVLNALTAVCRLPRAELMSERVEIAELVEVCLVLSAVRRPESALTNPEMRLEVSIPDPTPLRLLSAMVPTAHERPDFAPLQHFLAFFTADKAGQAADSEESAARTYL